MRRLARHAAGYAAASAVALAVDVTLLVTLVEWANWHYLAAATVSFMAGAVVAYAIVITWVFDYRRIENRKLEFSLFCALGLVGLAINAGTIHLLVESAALNYVLAKGVAAGLTFSANFLLRRWLLFTRWAPPLARNAEGTASR